MKELELLRYDIDRIDSRLIELYNERMSVVSEVAEYKYQKGEAIFQPDREEMVLNKAALLAGEENGKKVRLLYKTLMRQSRERQYEILSADSSVAEIIGCKIETEILTARAAFAGLPGSYTHIAAKQLCPNAELSHFVHFDDVLEAVASGTCDMGILPIDNTTEGIVADVYEGLMKYQLYISDSITMPIRHCLLGIKGASFSGIKRVISHPQALGQCAEYIKNHGFETESEINTSVAAERIARECKTENAAVASPLSAELYGLDIIDKGINDADCNKTRFITVTKRPIVREDADRISLSFILPHQSGALVQILSIAADYQINLLNVQSLPLPLKPWEYRFYMDIAGNVNDTDIRSILLMLYTELEEIRFLGNYKDEGGQQK
jgi:chorismate mutase/prephenate dehydratase